MCYFLLAEKSKLITTLMSKFVYDLFEKRKKSFKLPDIMTKTFFDLYMFV